jgi:cysteine-rich repeat protein
MSTQRRRRFALGAILLAPLASMSCVDPAALDEGQVESEVTTNVDLVETSVSLSPAADVTTSAGGTFDATDTAMNQGTASAAATITVYKLAQGTTRLGSLGERNVAALAGGASDAAASPVTLTVPKGTPDGDYTVMACADKANTVAEDSEANNCTSTTNVVHVQSPDLVDQSVTAPATATLGVAFTVTDHVANPGAAPAPGSTTRFFISTDGTAHTKLIGTGTVGTLAAGDTGTDANWSVTVPSGVAAGSYYVLACADGNSQISEGSETNNCAASTSQVSVSGPDLVEQNVSINTNLMSNAGSITITETTANVGAQAAGTSRTKWLLSTDAVVSKADDLFLSPTCGGAEYRAIGALNPTDSSTGSTISRLCGYVTENSANVQRVAPGTYYVFACADAFAFGGQGEVLETVETNNCTAAGTQLTVVACGDGNVDPGEQCDDGNLVDNDGCNDTCQTEANEPPVITSTPPGNAPLNTLYTYNATMTDPDGPSANWTLLGDTCGGSINGAGQYTFTPTTSGSCVVGIQVCDGGSPNLCAQQQTTIVKGRTVHIGAEITGTSANVNTSTWKGTVTVTVFDETNAPIAGAKVLGAWSPTPFGNPPFLCTTGANGQCTISTGNNAFSESVAQETWTVTSITLKNFKYNPAADVDTDVTLTNP